MIATRDAVSGARWVIMGAAGRDFHNFHTMVRDHQRGPRTDVVAFTATQIPGIDGRTYPAELAGDRYPQGIQIVPEIELAALIKREGVTDAIFSYSDVAHADIMAKAALVQAAGAHFVLPGVTETMIPSRKPVIAVCAVRTGCGKSQTSRMLVEGLIREGTKTVAVRHPMPYGDLVAQRVQRFATYEDMLRHQCTIEEMEEYEPYTSRGLVVFAGVDYGDILRAAEQESDVVLWDGGNNDTPFYAPDLHITVVDPLRPGHELSYYPGLVNLRMANVVVVNKVNNATPGQMEIVLGNIRAVNPDAAVVLTASEVTVADPASVRGKRVLVVEDGPTVTHGGMQYGAGVVAAQQYGAAELVDPVPYLQGSLARTFAQYKHLAGNRILPAMGYGDAQVADLAATIAAARCDVVVSGTPIDLGRLLAGKIDKPVVRVAYESRQVQGRPLQDIVSEAVARAAAAKAHLGEV
ncbi:MAG: GTPase [Candidatus Saganbacteria bacterium]|nr:GTPase [Candidatus Saganbacteria bacterium]